MIKILLSTFPITKMKPNLYPFYDIAANLTDPQFSG